ncbi:hypothetical protein IFR05_003019 [Cadophora sp. M221]|nr:hypothetical protein IFR05_003019 [Cadophora sp. M221]
MEVETLSRIHEETDVPVPRIHGWGLATHNTLGLGPFIIMDFIEGSPVRPLTFKVHDIIQLGGLNTFGDRSQGFTSTTEYFLAKLSSFNALHALIPDFVRKDYDRGPFKLLCDDFGLANMIVRSKDDLTIAGVVDLEWSYAGPAQLFGSALWWFLQSRLTPYDAEFKKEAVQSAAILTRYLKYLEIFKRILKEEEEQLPGHQSEKLSSLVEWSQASGAIWLHMILQTGFNYVSSIPFAQLRKHIGAEKWEKTQNEFLGTEAIKALVTKKTAQLDQYDEALEQIRDLNCGVGNGELNAAAREMYTKKYMFFPYHS